MASNSTTPRVLKYWYSPMATARQLEETDRICMRVIERIVKVTVRFWRPLQVISLPLLLLPIPILINTQEAKCVYMIALMTLYWMTEVVPMAVTGMIPIVLLPILGILSPDRVARNYMKDIMVMVWGILVIAIGIETSNLHKRIALRILLTIGTRPRWLLLGFILTTGLLSMCVNGLAICAMMVSIAESILQETEHAKSVAWRHENENGVHMEVISEGNSLFGSIDSQLDSAPTRGCDTNGNAVLSAGGDPSSPDQVFTSPEPSPLDPYTEIILPADSPGKTKSSQGNGLLSATKKKTTNLRMALYLGILYSSAFGTTAMLNGSPVNLVLFDILRNRYGTTGSLNFLSWMAFGVPINMVMLLVSWLWLQVLYIGFRRRTSRRAEESQADVIKNFLTQKYSELGSIRFEEVEVLTIFIAIVALWIMREPGYTRGWGELFAPNVVTESAPSILAAILFFILPKRISGLCSADDDVKWEPILDWKTLQKKMPWGLFLFIGGGISMGEAAQVSGLTAWIGQQMSVFQSLPPVAILFITCALCVFLTELMSNLATASITLPILASICEDLRIHPLYLMLPTVIGCTYAFMLPVATINNALIHERSGMKTIDMVKAGLPMNIFSIILLPSLLISYGTFIFDMGEYPAWAEQHREAGS